MTNQSVFLRCRTDIVGFARFVLDPDNGNPSTVIHGHLLQTFANAGESLVAIYDVRVFVEFEKLPYPYKFKSVDGIPKILGDMNVGGTMFKAVVAWDFKKTVPSSFPFPSLAEDLQTHSVSIISPIRHLLPRSESKVTFQETSASKPSSTNAMKKPTHGMEDLELIDLTGDSDEESNKHSEPANSEKFSDRLGLEPREKEDDSESESDVEEITKVSAPDHIEESVDQWDMESESDVEEITKVTVPDHIEESVDQWDMELREEGSNSENESDIEQMEKSSEENDVECSPHLSKLDTSEDPDLSSSDAYRSQRSLLGLSPAERIMLRINKSRRTKSQKGSGKRSKEKSPRVGSSHSFAGLGRRSSTDSVSRLIPSSRETVSFALNGDDFATDFNGIGVNSTALKHEESDDFDIPSNGEGNLSSGENPQSCQRQRGLGVLPSLRKRTYRFVNRKMESPKPLGIRKKSAIDLIHRSRHINPFEKPKFCCNNGCHSMVNSDFAAAQYRRFLQMDRADRKRALHLMLSHETNSFWFDGNEVCSRFMVTLSFSNQLQSAVKATQKARATSSVMACPREVRELTKKDKIIMFLRNIAGCVGDALPTKSQCNLPLLTKKQVYQRYMKSDDPLSEENSVSFSYFCDVWKKQCFDFKTHRHHGFAVCTTCEQLRSSLAKCDSTSKQDIIRAKMDEHYSFIKEERRGYAERANLAKEFPGKYVSIIVDGADQKGYGLPHFVFNTKDDKGHKMKVKCIGVLEHGQEMQLSLFTMTEEFQTGANHVLEAVHRVLQKKKEKHGTLPQILFIQVDNCTRENKNKYFMGFCELLVALGVFVRVQVSCLPIGHTHSDVDQKFSCVASRLRMNDAVTMDDLIHELSCVDNPRATAETMDKIANFSGLCDATGCLRTVKGISQYRFFRFSRAHQSESRDNVDEHFATTCHVKVQLHDEWELLDKSGGALGILKSLPRLRDTPSTDTTPPDNVLEVNKHLESVEERVGCRKKMESLVALKEKVYTRRVVSFHWDLSSCFELNGDNKELDDLGSTESVPEASNADFNAPDLTYPLNSFLAIKTAPGCQDPFWIARVLEVAKRNAEGGVEQLKVRWYQAKRGSEDAFHAQYRMATYTRGSRRQCFDDKIDVRSILCQFENLNQSGALHIRTLKAIRQCLNLN